MGPALPFLVSILIVPFWYSICKLLKYFLKALHFPPPSRRFRNFHTHNISQFFWRVSLVKPTNIPGEQSYYLLRVMGVAGEGDEIQNWPCSERKNGFSFFCIIGQFTRMCNLEVQTYKMFEIIKLYPTKNTSENLFRWWKLILGTLSTCMW